MSTSNIKKYSLVVVDKIFETSDAVTIKFKQPGLKKIRYEAGQYFTLSVKINNKTYKRAYSLSSSPSVDATLDITVKRVERGLVSNHLIDVVNVGDIIEVLEPLGNFTFDVSTLSSPGIFLWGAGSGITPLISIIKKALYQSTVCVTLVYINRSESTCIFFSQLNALRNSFTERFKIIYFFTGDEFPLLISDFRVGRIIKEDVWEIAGQDPDFNLGPHYICGPSGLKNIVKPVLIELGMSPEKILFEDFNHIVNETQLEGVYTQMVRIIRAENTFDVEVVRGKSILEAALESIPDLPYSCQTGNCTLCKARLISGEIKTVTEESPQEFINENERLLCCSYPLSEGIEILVNT